MHALLSFPGDTEFDRILTRAQTCLEGASQLHKKGNTRASQGALLEAMSCVEQAYSSNACQAQPAAAQR